MKLGQNIFDPQIKIRPLYGLFNRIFKGLSFMNTIYLNKDIYSNLISKDPKPENVGVYLHEKTHVHRYRSKNLLIYALKYWLSSNFRYNEELEANIPQIKYIKIHGGVFDISNRAKKLSGLWYLWCVNYDKAVRDLKKIWKNA